jgi:hypothetical protein
LDHKINKDIIEPPSLSYEFMEDILEVFKRNPAAGWHQHHPHAVFGPKKLPFHPMALIT